MARHPNRDRHSRLAIAEARAPHHFEVGNPLPCSIRNVRSAGATNTVAFVKPLSRLELITEELLARPLRKSNEQGSAGEPFRLHDDPRVGFPTPYLRTITMHRRPNRTRVLLRDGDVVGLLSAPQCMNHREKQQIVKMRAMLEPIFARDEIRPGRPRRYPDKVLKRLARQRTGIEQITKRSRLDTGHLTLIV